MDAQSRVPAPVNEPVLGYAPGSPERATLQRELDRIGSECIDLPSTIGGRKVMGDGREASVVQPHAHAKVLGRMKLVSADQAQSAVDAAMAAAPICSELTRRELRVAFSTEISTKPMRVPRDVSLLR